jgi:multidrug resistance efflux pump
MAVVIPEHLAHQIRVLFLQTQLNDARTRAVQAELRAQQAEANIALTQLKRDAELLQTTLQQLGKEASEQYNLDFTKIVVQPDGSVTYREDTAPAPPEPRV